MKFKIFRYHPESQSFRTSTYEVPVRPGMTLLDALNYITDNLDGTLAYRYSCRMGMCGSCAISVNGKPMLACYTQVLDLGSDEVVIEPLPNLHPIRDLVVDLSDFMERFRQVKPYLLRVDPPPTGKELIQTISEHKKVWGLTLCTKCAACLGACPASADENFPGPTHLLVAYRFIADSRDQGLEERLNFYREGVWLCSSCSSCDLVCPKNIKPSEAIIEERKLITGRGFPPRTAKDALMSLVDKHNPWNFSQGERNGLLRELGVKFLGEGGAGTLLFACCNSTYDPRCTEAVRSIIGVLKRVGVELTSLGMDEWCCGDPALRLGEAGLFECLVEHNSSMFQKFNLVDMVTISPHCFNVFKKEKRYSELGLNVKHHTQVLAELIDEGGLKFSKRLEARVTFHDPCFLGKINGVFEEPRKVLESIPGIELVEMKRNRENSFCCGGGGGRIWAEESVPHGERPSIRRVMEAAELGVDIIATACPFCLMVLGDALKTLNLEERIKALDVGTLAHMAF